MSTDNDKELIKLIKNKHNNEINEIFNKNHIKLEKVNYFQNTLLYLITNNYSFDIIKFFLLNNYHNILL